MTYRSALIIFALFSSSSSQASCLDEVALFANRICGAIEKTGTKTTVDGSGKLDINVGKIVRQIVGSGSADVSGRLLVDSYEGVLQDQLGAEIFNVRSCREKMVPIAVAQVCKSSSSVNGSSAPIVANSKSENKEFLLAGGESALLTSDSIPLSAIGNPFGARGDLFGVRLRGKIKSMSVGSIEEITSSKERCSVTLLQITNKNEGRFLLSC